MLNILKVHGIEQLKCCANSWLRKKSILWHTAKTATRGLIALKCKQYSFQFSRVKYMESICIAACLWLSTEVTITPAFRFVVLICCTLHVAYIIDSLIISPCILFAGIVRCSPKCPLWGID